MKCNNCGIEIEDDATFCHNCGMTIKIKNEQKNNSIIHKYCRFCGKSLIQEASFCSSCGNPTTLWSENDEKIACFCAYCGKEKKPNANRCNNCGHDFGPNNESLNSIETLYIAQAFIILSLIGCIVISIITLIYDQSLNFLYFFIPVFWVLPTSIALAYKINNEEEISILFKIWVLLFVNLISGIILLCYKQD